MSKYVLRWQYGVFAGETRTHYTYGNLDMLKYKAKELAKNNKIVYITIDEVKEVIKDIRLQTAEELLK
ncbi:MAG: hypothetical protein J6D47_01190 [Peptostreptococcaceae bacterium]|nr:hypothetical protein [Peptostreptococcaceae bacterium]